MTLALSRAEAQFKSSGGAAVGLQVRGSDGPAFRVCKLTALTRDLQTHSVALLGVEITAQTNNTCTPVPPRFQGSWFVSDTCGMSKVMSKV